MSQDKKGGSNTPKPGEQGFQLSKEGKKAPTSAKDLDRLKTETEDAQAMAYESNQPEAFKDFEAKREKYEKALTEEAMLVIITLEEDDKIDIRLAHINEKGERQPDIYLKGTMLDAETIESLKQGAGFNLDGKTFRVLYIKQVGKATEAELAKEDELEKKAKEGEALVEKLVKELHTFSKKDKALLFKELKEMADLPGYNKAETILDIITNDDYESVLPIGKYLPAGNGMSEEEKAPFAAVMYFGVAERVKDELSNQVVAMFQKPFLSVRPNFKSKLIN